MKKQRVDQGAFTAHARGRFGAIDSYISALRWLHRQENHYDWVILLSGKDYPIRPLTELSEKLEKSPVDGYFYFFDPLDEQFADSGRMEWPISEAKNRYLFQYNSFADKLSLFERAAMKVPEGLLAAFTQNYRINTSVGLRIGRRSEKTPFSPMFRLYSGSFWHIVRRKCAQALVEFVDENPHIVEYFRHVLFPTESFVQTVLLNNRRFNLSPFDLRYSDLCSSRYGRARTLSAADLPAAFASGCFFAGEFDMKSNAGILDHLKIRVLG